MSSKSAILFYGKSKTPITFTKYKIYQIGTGYVALYENADNCCVLCRLLDKREISSFANNLHTLVIKDKEVTEHSVIIISAEINCIDDADKIVSQIIH